MKVHLFAGALLALATALAIGACDDSESSESSGGAGYGTDDFCGSFQSCTACTPQDGCGWCYDSDGTGQCVSSPNACATPAFDWTWNPDGCRVPAQTRTAPLDAGEALEASPVASPDAGAGEDAETSVDASVPSSDARANACVQTVDASPPFDGGDAASSACVTEGP